jgi:hypothetical protein
MRWIRALSGSVSIAVGLSFGVAAPAHEGPHGGHDAEGVEPMTIQAVVPGGPADAAGVAAGDRLLELAGIEVATLGDLEQAIGRRRPGDTVPVVVLRGGDRVELSLTLGERPDGRASLGVSLAVMSGPAGGSVDQGLGRQECLAWVDQTYRAAESIERFGLDLRADLAAARACMERDVAMMAVPIPHGWCDNVFKVHCSGLDLLAAIGEAQIGWCEQRLGAELGVDLGADPAWTDCAADRLFEGYSVNGQTSDETGCRAALEECSGPR